MARTRLVVHAVLLACVAALLTALPSGATPEPPEATETPAAEECATLGRTIASVWRGQRSEDSAACAALGRRGAVALRFVQPAGSEPVDLRVVDSTGETVCEVRGGPEPVCYLGNDPSYRAEVIPGSLRDFEISVVELDAGRRGCPTLEPGRFGTRDGVDVAFDGGAFADCFSVPAEELRDARNVFAYERVGGSGEADLVVRPEALAGHRECTASGQGGVGSAVCDAADNTGYLATVLLVSDAQPSTWRLARRVPRAGEAAGCQPVDSTDIEGPVSAGTTDSYVALDCWEVPAEPTDRFAIDLFDGDGTTKPHVFGGGRYQCSPDDPVCLADDERRYFVVPVPGGPVPAEGHDYELQPWRVADVHGWSSECERYGDYDQPFGPVTGTLSAAASGRCVLLDSFNGASYAFDLGAGAPQPTVRALVTHQNGYFERCHPTSDQGIRCGQLGDPLNTAPLLISRPDGVATLDYSVAGECAETTCDVLPPLEAVTEPVVVGRHAVGEWLSVETGAWAPEEPVDFSYLWLVDGTPVSEASHLLLTEEMRGHDVSVRVITDRIYYESTVVLTEPRTVRAAPAELRRAPEISGRARAGRELTVDPGTWRPRPDRYRFAWYAGERRLAADGRRLTLRRHHVGKRITVGVVAVAGGDRVGRATARSARVRGR